MELYEQIVRRRIDEISAKIKLWEESSKKSEPRLFKMLKDTEHLKLEVQLMALQGIVDEAEGIKELAGDTNDKT